MSIYKACDIRGVYGQDLTEADAYRIGRAAADRMAGRSVVVGGDFRVSTPALKEQFIRGLLQGGAQVTDVGKVSTPQLYFSKAYLGAYASVQITASHNPAKYNGVKLMFGEWPIEPADIERLKTAVETESYLDRPGGSLTKADTTVPYEAMLTDAFRGGARRGHIVIDAGNGAMGEVAPRVMEKLGFRITRLFCEIDGAFPGRDPNPAVVSNLTALCEKVREVNADFGAAFDGDGDRVIFVDGCGVPLSAEEAMVLLSKHLLEAGDSFVYDIKCSSIVRNTVRAMGCTPVMERSGHAFIRRTFMERNSRLAGEVSGHHFFRELQGDDGLFALVKMAELFSLSTGSLRDALVDVQYPAITPDIRTKATNEEVDRVFARMEQWAARETEAQVSRLDGIRMEFPDGSWVLLRRSVTEPLYTLRMEAGDAAALNALEKTVWEKLGKE